MTYRLNLKKKGPGRYVRIGAQKEFEKKKKEIADASGVAWCRCPCGREGAFGTTHNCKRAHSGSKRFNLCMRLVVPEETRAGT